MEYSKEDLMEAKKQIWGVGENMAGDEDIALYRVCRRNNRHGHRHVLRADIRLFRWSGGCGNAAHFGDNKRHTNAYHCNAADACYEAGAKLHYYGASYNRMGRHEQGIKGADIKA